MIVRATSTLVDILRWSERQNTNLELYIEWWLTNPEQREEAPYQVEVDIPASRGQLLWGSVVVGAFRLVDGNDYVLDWIRSVRDSELMGSFALEGMDDGNGD